MGYSNLFDQVSKEKIIISLTQLTNKFQYLFKGKYARQNAFRNLEINKLEIRNIIYCPLPFLLLVSNKHKTGELVKLIRNIL